MRSELPLDEWVPMLRQVALEAPNVNGTTPKLPPVSLAAAAIDRVPTVQELIESIIQGADSNTGKLAVSWVTASHLYSERPPPGLPTTRYHNWYEVEALPPSLAERSSSFSYT